MDDDDNQDEDEDREEEENFGDIRQHMDHPDAGMTLRVDDDEEEDPR